MASRHDTMMNPPIEELLGRVPEGSKFTLVTLGAKRARQINSYYNQLSEGLGTVVPPQVQSTARKPLSIAFEEIAQGLIVPTFEPEDDETAEGAEASGADAPTDGAGS